MQPGAVQCISEEYHVTDTAEPGKDSGHAVSKWPFSIVEALIESLQPAYVSSSSRVQGSCQHPRLSVLCLFATHMYLVIADSPLRTKRWTSRQLEAISNLSKPRLAAQQRRAGHIDMKSKSHFLQDLDLNSILEPADPSDKNYCATKIVGTIGPACQAPEKQVAMLEAGMSAARYVQGDLS